MYKSNFTQAILDDVTMYKELRKQIYRMKQQEIKENRKELINQIWGKNKFNLVFDEHPSLSRNLNPLYDQETKTYPLIHALLEAIENSNYDLKSKSYILYCIQKIINALLSINVDYLNEICEVFSKNYEEKEKERIEQAITKKQYYKRKYPVEYDLVYYNKSKMVGEA